MEIWKDVKGFEGWLQVSNTGYLGFYKDIQDAIKARTEAEEKYHKPIIEKETLY